MILRQNTINSQTIWLHLIIVCLLLLISGYIWPVGGMISQAANDGPVGPGAVYLALGDSLATGTEEPNNDDGLPGYPAVLFERLRTRYPTIGYENLARDGEDTSTIRAAGGQLDQAIVRINELRAAGTPVRLVTLSIGGNDIVSILPPNNADPSATLATFRANFATILDRLQAALLATEEQPQADLLVMDYYNPYPGLPLLGIGAMAAEWIPQFNAAISELAAERGIPVAAVAAAFVGREVELIYVQRPYPTSFLDPLIRQRLDYHPRPAGHAVIAAAFWRANGYGSTVYLPIIVRSLPAQPLYSVQRR